MPLMMLCFRALNFSLSARDRRENISEMSWNVISNSNILRVNSFNCTKMKSSSPLLPKGQENFAPQLLEYMNDIFTALDNTQTGFITVEDLEKYWKKNETGFDMFLMSHYGISSADVVQCMIKITPENGLFSFRKFIRGMKMAVSNAKNDRLRKLFSGSSKAQDRSKTHWKPVNSIKPCEDLKPDRRLSTSTDGESKMSFYKGPKRPLQEQQLYFGQSVDEECTSENKSKPGLLSKSTADGEVGQRKSAFRVYDRSFELDSFISKSDTIDYTGRVMPKTDSSGSKRNLQKVAINSAKDDISRVKQVSRRFGDSRYRAFRKTDLDCLVDQASEKIRMMQKCMEATENARNWYTRMIATLQQDRMELRRLVFLGKSKEETEAKVDRMKNSWEALTYDDVKRSMNLVSYYNEQLQNMRRRKVNETDVLAGSKENPAKSKGDIISPLKPTTKLILEKLVEGQSRQIKQLENEKAALVKEVFLMKGRLNVIEKPIDQVVPF